MKNIKLKTLIHEYIRAKYAEKDSRRLLINTNVATSLTPDMRSVKTKWLLDDCSFIWVLPIDLLGTK